MPSEIDWVTRSLSWMGWVEKVPLGTGAPSGRRNSGTTMLMRWRRGSLALITHFGAWKSDEIGLYPKIRWTARSWPLSCTKTLAWSILSKLSLLNRLKFQLSSVSIYKFIRKTEFYQVWKKKKKKDLYVSTLDLVPHLVAPLSSGKGDHHSTPLTTLGNLCSTPCWIREGIGWA